MEYDEKNEEEVKVSQILTSTKKFNMIGFHKTQTHHKMIQQKLRTYSPLLIHSISILIIFLLINHVTSDLGNSLENCRKSGFSSGSDFSLNCQLRTINGELAKTNFSDGIILENVIQLDISCSDVHFYQSSLNNGNLGSLLPRLASLNIEHCKLSRIGKGILSGLTFLRNLTIRTHNTAWPVLSLDIGIDAFLNLKQLERIDLSANNIWTFPDQLFCPIKSLENLNVSLNRLQDISDLSFREKDMKELNFDLSSSSSVSISKGGTSANKNPSQISPGISNCKLGIQILDVSQNRLILLPTQGLSSLTQLKELYLEGNEISIVAERALNGLKGLKILNLSHNKIQLLPDDTFSDTPDISEIYLQNNSLNGNLGKKIFRKLEQLIVLDLSHNILTSNWMNGYHTEDDQIDSIREDILVDTKDAGSVSNQLQRKEMSSFDGLIRLVVLNLGYNRLTRLIPETFKDLYSLQILNLEYNEIELIEGNTFSSMNNLHTLILSHNQIKTIQPTSLNGLFVLSLLSLDNNNISLIPSTSFHNCSSLRDLNLNGNSFTEIPEAIQNLTLLKTVDLGENQIDTLETPPKLIGLPNLYGLRLTGNRIINVSKDALKELPSLKILNLARNQIQNVEQGSFDSNSNLQAVRLDSNYISDISNLFGQNPSLIWLNLSDNHLSWFDYALIPSQLQWIDLHKNEINEIGNFYTRTDLRLQTLDISFNRLTQIGSNSIPDSIEMLFLNDNLINHVEPHTFFKKSNLSRVDLFANQIETLELSSLRLMPFPEDKTLPEFYIGGNPIICDCNSEWLQRINKLDHLRQHPKVMDLDSVYCKLLYHRDKYYVPLAEADPSQFLCSYETHCFHLCHCCDFDACDCQMTCPDNCTCYHDDTWTANIADCASKGHTSVPNRIPMDSTEVYLDGNFFEELPSHVFIARKNLQVLFLNNSGISLIGNNSFSGLKRLTILHLENNFITELQGYEFKPLESLRELYLQSNQIRFIANNTFIPLRSLEILQLDGNGLTRYAFWTLSQNPYLVEVSLGENLWSCDCDFVASATPWIQSNQAKLLDPTSIKCFLTKDNVKSSSLILGTMNRTKCSTFSTVLSDAIEGQNGINRENNSLPGYWPLICGVMALSLIFGMILLAICHKTRSLRFLNNSKCFLFGNCSRFSDTEEDEKLYDAYVAYSVKDEVWVSQVFANELSGCSVDPPYRLLLHYKEFNGTTFITDTIVEAVESSKRTIIILSKNFIQSEWSRFEFKSALHAALRGKKNRFVAITLGDLPTRDLDPDLRVALRSATILSANDKLFWNKLRSALPVPRSTTNPYVNSSRFRSSGTLGTSGIHHHLPPPPSVHHHHNSISAGFGTYSNSLNGTISRNHSSGSNCNSLATTPQSGSVSVSVPLYVPPFPPPNRPPPPFPTPKRPPPPTPPSSSGLLWG